MAEEIWAASIALLVDGDQISGGNLPCRARIQAGSPLRPLVPDSDDNLNPLLLCALGNGGIFIMPSFSGGISVSSPVSTW